MLVLSRLHCLPVVFFKFIDILKGSVLIPHLENCPAVVIYVFCGVSMESCGVLLCSVLSCAFQAYRLLAITALIFISVVSVATLCKKELIQYGIRK